MESYKKRSLMFLSISQIVMSVLFFILGMIDGLKIRYVYVSLLFTPCWIAALVSIFASVVTRLLRFAYH